MQHLAQEIPKLLIVGNTEDIKRGVCGEGITLNAPCFYILLLSICLCLLSKAGYWAGWTFHLPWGGSVLCLGLEWAVPVKPHHPGSDNPKRDFPFLPKPLWL